MEAIKWKRETRGKQGEEKEEVEEGGGKWEE